MESYGNQLRVLIVEDEILIRKYLILFLENVGCKIVGETASGEEAVHMAVKEGPELILIDIRLKGEMDGFETAQKVSAQINSAILFMSAYDYKTEITNEDNPNILGYLKKPVEEQELENYIKKIKRK